MSIGPTADRAAVLDLARRAEVEQKYHLRDILLVAAGSIDAAGCKDPNPRAFEVGLMLGGLGGAYGRGLALYHEGGDDGR